MKGRTIITSTEHDAKEKAKEILQETPFNLAETPMMLSWSFENGETAARFTQQFAEMFAYVRRK